MKICLEELVALANRAGQRILDEYHDPESTWVEHKKDGSPLTRADMASHQLILAGLQAMHPGVPVLSEEGKEDEKRLSSTWCFVVDPLDGTKEFLARNGEFTVNIAACCAGEAVAGVIHAPASGESFYAMRGQGAWMTGADRQCPVRLQTSQRTRELILVQSRSHASAEVQALYQNHERDIARTVAVGSSLKGCLIARGEADAYYRFGLTCEWDTAAMQCIVEEAGGIFRQMDGTPMRYNRKDTLNRKGFYIVNRKENIWV